MGIASVLRSLFVLRLIAVFKFFKAAVVIGTGFGLLSLANPEIVQAIQRFADTQTAGVEQRLLRNLLAFLVGVPTGRLHLIAVASFLYAGLFLVEGIGLWKGRHWAEWLTVVATSSLIPIEVYELVQAPHLNTVIVIAVNVLILGYLIWRMRRPSGSSRMR
jgi:uncharacterized membrane protein (DUF2068 family)